MAAIGGNSSEPLSNPSSKARAFLGTLRNLRAEAVASNESSSQSRFPRLRSAMKGYHKQLSSHLLKKSTASSKSLGVLRRSTLSVPWSRLAVFEAVFMSVVTLIVLFLGVLLDYVGYDSSTSGRACRTAGCRQSLKLLEDARDRNGTNPCDDFYQHVCGSWKGSLNTVTDTLDKAADEVLALPLRGSGMNQSSLQKLAGFYKSCLAEAKANTSLTNAVTFTINYYNLTYQYLVETASDPAAILNFMMRMTILHKVDIGFKVSLHDGTITIGLTSSLTAKWHGAPQVAFDLISSSVSATASSKDVEAAMAIDAIAIRGPPNKPATTRLFIEDLVNQASFGASLQDWVNTIERYHTNLTQVTKETQVITNGLDRLSRMSDALQRATTSVRAVFLYLHVLVRVGQLHVLRRIRDGRQSAVLLQEFCRGRIYATVLNKPLQVQMGKTLKYETSRNYVLDMIDRVAQEMYLKVRDSWLLPDVVSEIQRVLREQPRYFFWQQDRVMEELENIFSGVPEMTSNFLGNLYNVQSASYKVPMLAPCAIHRDNVFHVDSNMNVTCGSTTVFGNPIFFHEAEDYVNYATIGFLYGLSIRGNMRLSDSNVHSTDYSRNVLCLGNERSNLEVGSVYDLEEVIHHVLSLSSALKASESVHPFRHRLELQMFFRRACYVLCSTHPDRAGAPFQLTPRQRCNLAVRHNRLFHAAFRCDPRNRLASIEACQLV